MLVVCGCVWLCVVVVCGCMVVWFKGRGCGWARNEADLGTGKRGRKGRMDVAPLSVYEVMP